MKIPEFELEEILMPTRRFKLPEGFRFLNYGEEILKTDWIVFSDHLESASRWDLTEHEHDHNNWYVFKTVPRKVHGETCIREIN